MAFSFFRLFYVKPRRRGGALHMHLHIALMYNLLIRKCITMKIRGRLAVRILVLTPFIMMVFSTLTLLVFPIIFLFDLNTRIMDILFSGSMLMGIYALTAGVLMAIGGTVMGAIKKMPLYVVLGVVLTVFLLAVDTWLCWAVFLNKHIPGYITPLDTAVTTIQED